MILAMLAAALCAGGCELWKMSERYVQEARVKGALEKYQPIELQVPTSTPDVIPYTASPIIDESPTDIPATEEPAATEEPVIINQYIVDLQNEVNADITGWLTIPYTNIDYPLVMPDDFDTYLKRDVYGNESKSGALFLDYRCDRNFSDFNTIIYGHNMRNQSMFGDLSYYKDESFFNRYKTGTVHLVYKTYSIEIFACMIIESNDSVIYGTAGIWNDFVQYVRNNALYFSEPDTEGKIITLSTCSSAFENARLVVVAVAAEIL
jgi:sortase B